MNLSFTASDLLVKTSYKDKYRPLLGPATLGLTLGCVWGDHSGPRNWPRILVFFESGPVELFIGQEHAMCAAALHRHIAMAMEVNFLYSKLKLNLAHFYMRCSDVSLNTDYVNCRVHFKYILRHFYMCFLKPEAV